MKMDTDDKDKDKNKIDNKDSVNNEEGVVEKVMVGEGVGGGAEKMMRMVGKKRIDLVYNAYKNLERINDKDKNIWSSNLINLVNNENKI